ncbi:MAG: sugar phosphate isomerase/epimerase, partial [Candidatus Hydrogenedentes bacterium]|nr:sugar phosphate isomerase/epimerase [Candidatus Hydrogenedentota bacterium]
AVLLGGRVFAAKKDKRDDASYGGFRMGSQSYSFRYFKDPAVAIEKLKELGLTNMEFCSVHFRPDASDSGFAQIKALVASTGISVPVYGVEGFGKDDAANRKKFEFAKALGLEIMSADIEKEVDAFKSADALCKEFNVKIGIHNHGPGARYDKVTDTLDAVKGSSTMIGACVDTGHVIRSGEKPHEVIAALGERVHSLHLKDWKHGGAEQIVGEGDMDLVAVARALKAIKFAGPIMLEYEDHEDDPVPHMKKGLENWQKACDQA